MTTLKFNPQEALYKFAVIEDNAGGLHLFVFDNKEIHLCTGYEYNPGQLCEDLIELMSTDNPITNWETQDGKVLWNEFCENEYGYDVIVDNDGFYFEKMGFAGSNEFKDYLPEEEED